jgi:hypothetical protein
MIIIYTIWILLSIQNWLNDQQTKKDIIPNLKLLECSNKKAIKLSDLASESRLVKLETKDSSLIGRDSRYIVGSKYIICITRSNILQFDSNGGFIRNVAQTGRGPGEFVNITGVDIDKEEKNLFFTSSNSKMIQKVDLNTGKFSTPISIAKGGLSACKIVILKDKIAVFPTITDNEGFLVCYQDLFGKYIEGIPVKYKRVPQLKIRADRSLLSQGNNIYYFEPMICGDTIFQISTINKTPMMIVNGGEDFGHSNDDPTGYITLLLSKSKDTWIFANQLIEVKNNALRLGDVHYYTVEGKDSRLSEITQFTLDNLGKTYSFEELKAGFLTTSLSVDLAREQFVFKIESIEFKKIVADNKMTVPENELTKIKRLDKEISIYDNPVLLIGKLK